MSKAPIGRKDADPKDVDLGRLRDLAGTGASGAALAVAQLIGSPVAQRTAPGDVARGGRSTGTFFQVKGHLTGGIALLLSRDSRDTVMRNLLGGVDGVRDPDAIASAFCEFGNIVASRTVSAVADTLDARIVISVPQLAMENAEAALEDWVAEHRRHGPVMHLESELAEVEGTFDALLVFVLDL